MAMSDLYTVDSGSTTTSDVLTYNTTSDTWKPVKIYNGGRDQLQFKKAAKPKAVKREVHVKKGFWDGVEWEEYTSYVPRKSITGKIIIGKMYKRWRTPPPRSRGKGLGVFKEFAKTKELFEEKLRGNA